MIFSHYNYFDKVLDHIVRDWCKRERVSYIWQKGRFIPYPFQNNIHRLSAEDFHECIDGLVEMQQQNISRLTKPRTFLEWLQNNFGRGIVNLFMAPYNRKVWGYEPSEMNAAWMEDRVATVDLTRIKEHKGNGTNDTTWGPNHTFRFPLRGGTGFIWRRIYEGIDLSKFRFNSEIVAVDADRKLLRLADGSDLPYRNLISTMPLDRLCGLVVGRGLEDLPALVPRFRYSSTHVVGIGVAGQPPAHLQGQCWMYFPEDDCPFYRVTVFSNYSPYNVPMPGQQWSLMAEVCETAARPVDPSNIVDSVLQGFYTVKLLNVERDKVISRFHRRLEYGYPTPFLEREEVCGRALEALEAKDIKSRGRFGAWKYEVSNQDHSMMQGVEAVDAIVMGAEETTVRLPGVVNSKAWKKAQSCARRCHQAVERGQKKKGLEKRKGQERGDRKLRYYDPLALTVLLKKGWSMGKAESAALIDTCETAHFNDPGITGRETCHRQGGSEAIGSTETKDRIDGDKEGKGGKRRPSPSNVAPTAA